ncbi:MAG: sulfurtransferase [Acidobacteriota bacterium]
MKITARLLILPLLAAICFCFAVQLSVAAQTKPVATPKVRAEMLVTTDWLAKHLTDKTVFVLHVARERRAFDEGHIPGARFVALGDILATRDGIQNELPPVEKLQKYFENLGIGDSGKIVIYGDSNGLAAARTYFTLDYLGHGDRAALLDGGLEKWKAEKRQLETQAIKTESARFTPRLRTDVVAKLDAMRDLSWTAANVAESSAAIIDARPAEQYVGAANTRSGHIPGASNLFWMQHLTNATELTMKPATELKKLYEAVGLKPGQQAITYCNTGIQASHAYFTLKYLGYDVKMYDGSFTEWSKAEGAPVVSGKERK